MSNPEVLEQIEAEIQAYQHAVQTGVGLVNDNLSDRGECTPKHLRVGVNAAMVDASAIAMALIGKGVITSLDYARARRELWRREYESYRDQARAKSGNPSLDLA